ncbi:MULTISPECIES: adenylate/guanylate cyclase domain-containing protein [Roseobacteraceae]|jgi:class 3 adenylate cyclase|uniref:Adenylate and guanylate cyclase catalytic domain protein n=1 Tax=Pseudosulfitobacter pseudonitzschiae TaxID=1402135 RepID=A0A221JWW3_9RHOB|nr:MULTISPECIES: adenylate/guanylate cyclase domain-containing protein [Roseobacteraceae]ASM71225.1 adenylate and guanylate cyclase catalytic domain protein [Pseudosulfitobacter pseudonitzschiae]
MSQLPDIKRKLTTILSADAANYSGRMARNEVDTVQALRRARRVIDAAIFTRGGRIANTSGDGLIAEFSSVVEGVAAAVTIQRELNVMPDALPFRIGVHLGDVIIEGDDLLGDGVNLAARLQENAVVGGILVSRQVVDHARGRLDVEFRPLGPATPKNLIEEIALYAVLADGVAAPGDLASVAPRVDLQPPHHTSQDPVAAFRKSCRRAALAAGVLVIIDIFNGAGPGWPALVITAIGVSLLLKWRNLRATKG